MTRRGRMMVVMLDDGTAQLEISVFNELFEQHRDKLKEDELLIVQGKAQNDEFSGGLRVTAEELIDLAALRAKYAGRLKLSMNGAGRREEAAADAHALPRQRQRQLPGDRALPERRRRVRGGAGRRLARAPDAQLISELSAWLAPENVQVGYA